MPPGKLLQIQFDGFAQGSTYRIIYYAGDTVVHQQEIDSVLKELDQSLSLYVTNSLINQFNRSVSGITPDIHIRKVVKKALDTYRCTSHLFDITVFPLTTAWGFGPVKPDSLPDDARIQALLPCVNSDLLYWKKGRLLKKDPCVQLDANGIAQGYSVDVLAGFLDGRGVKHYLVELGGEIRIKGRKPDTAEKMRIGIEGPGEDPDMPPIQQLVYLDRGAITTSGNYKRYYESGGRQITHLLNPQTGYPVSNELISVTLIAPDAMTADAYDNALMGMGLQRAIKFVEKRRRLAAYFIYKKSDGTIADTMSRRFAAYLRK